MNDMNETLINEYTRVYGNYTTMLAEIEEIISLCIEHKDDELAKKIMYTVNKFTNMIQYPKLED